MARKCVRAIIGYECFRLLELREFKSKTYCFFVSLELKFSNLQMWIFKKWVRERERKIVWNVTLQVVVSCGQSFGLYPLIIESYLWSNTKSHKNFEFMNPNLHIRHDNNVNFAQNAVSFDWNSNNCWVFIFISINLFTPLVVQLIIFLLPHRFFFFIFLHRT